MKRIPIFLLLLSLAAAVTSSAGPAQDLRVISLDPRLLRAGEAMALGLDVLKQANSRLYIVSTARDRMRLASRGIPYDFETSFSGLPSSRPASMGGGLNGDFHSYAELERDLRELEAGYPGLARVFDLGRSLEGRVIYGLKISDNVGLEEDEAQALFTGCHHAREWISVEVPFLLGKYLLEHYQSDGRIRDIVDHSEVWIVPLVNPDGLEYSIHVYRYWRKNRRANSDGSYGVDLNRNYGFQWGRDNIGSSPEPEDGVYRGTAAFSEPEAAAVRDLVGRNSFLALVSYHSYAQSILYPWGYTRIPLEGGERMKTLAEGMSRRIEDYRGSDYAFGQASYVSYLVNGDTTDWAFGIFGIPAYTIELPPESDQGGGFFNAESEILPVFNENLEAALYLIEDCMAVYVPPAAGSRGRERSPVKPFGGDRTRK